MVSPKNQTDVRTRREPLDVDGQDLLAACIEANVRSLASTTGALYANMQQQRDEAHDAFADLYDSLAAIPETVRSVAIDKLLWRHDNMRTTVDRAREQDAS